MRSGSAFSPSWRKRLWVPRDGLTITVADGIVGLDGVILEEKERDALRVAAENVPGVRAVEDRLVWVEPVSGTIIDAPQQRRRRSRRCASSLTKSAALLVGEARVSMLVPPPAASG